MLSSGQDTANANDICQQHIGMSEADPLASQPMIRDKLLEPNTFLLNCTVLRVPQQGKTLPSITVATDDPITIQRIILNPCLNF